MHLASTLPIQSRKQPHAVNPIAHLDETQAFERLCTLPQGVPHILHSRTKKWVCCLTNALAIKPNYVRSSKLPPPWLEYTNFCGRTYFYNFELRVCTEEDMYDHRLRTELYNAVVFNSAWFETDGYERWPWPSDVQHFLWYCRTAKQPHFAGITMSCQHGGVFGFLHDGKYMFNSVVDPDNGAYCIMKTPTWDRRKCGISCINIQCTIQGCRLSSKHSFFVPSLMEQMVSIYVLLDSVKLKYQQRKHFWLTMRGYLSPTKNGKA
jgi:hypothetical protein